jgi:soluble lytic murein transglycosylase
MQVMPGTARDPGFGIRPSDGTPAEDARVGREYLQKLLRRYNGDHSKMWAAYNWGPGNLDSALRRHGERWLANAPAETRAYVGKNIRALGGQ